VDDPDTGDMRLSNVVVSPADSGGKGIPIVEITKAAWHDDLASDRVTYAHSWVQAGSKMPPAWTRHPSCG
jgi:hypothetical protein